mmetsp:Transcript_16098/g.35316  ORF Transcript_16098/g.35316 Transcript_16098/m.35316 type:complete len:205 (-) Transcript_16098:748-1362(-)
MRFCSFSSASRSDARAKMSFSRFSAKVSTITATIRFKTPNTRVSSAPTKTTAVRGSSSITGIAILPQLSPATTVWKIVMLACQTEEKDRLHRSQDSQSPPLSAISCTTGLMISTAMMAHIVIKSINSRKDQNRVLKQLPIICSSRLSSLRMVKRRITRASLSKRHRRTTRIRPTPARSLPERVHMYSMQPTIIIKVSSRFHNLV